MDWRSGDDDDGRRRRRRWNHRNGKPPFFCCKCPKAASPNSRLLVIVGHIITEYGCVACAIHIDNWVLLLCWWYSRLLLVSLGSDLCANQILLAPPSPTTWKIFASRYSEFSFFFRNLHTSVSSVPLIWHIALNSCVSWFFQHADFEISAPTSVCRFYT